jgi:hypothetical protein
VQPIGGFLRSAVGPIGPAVLPLGLACLGMSGMGGPADETDGIATIHAVLDASVTLDSPIESWQTTGCAASLTHDDCGSAEASVR